MKTKFNFLLFFIASAFVLSSCNSDDPMPNPVEPSVSYIMNYGSYSGDKSSVTAFDKEELTATNGYYSSVNGLDMISNVQHAISHNDKIYFMGNNADQVFWVDGETFEQTENGISDDIVKPRFAVAQGNYMYVSCWGGAIWDDENLSYIAKINLTDKQIEKKIKLPGGPEGMAIANNKLYAALNYKDSVAVIDLGDETISYIETPAVTSFFLKDNNNNLYVSLISTFNDYSNETGIGYINTNNDQLEATYQLEGVSTSYVNILAANDDFSKVYIMTSAYDADWNLSGAVSVFDVANLSFESNKLVENVLGLNGIGFYNDNVFAFVAESVTGNGKAVIYGEDGTQQAEFETGIAPFMMLTSNNE
jgi:hypothetical protein